MLLNRISPDLVRERAKRARASTGLRRWVAEPGVDEWHGTFPSEDAATAWAAIDRLAHDLVAAGTCSNVEQARGKALTDLVTGNATVDVQVVLTVPADTGSRHTDAAEVTADSTPPVTLEDGPTQVHDARMVDHGRGSARGGRHRRLPTRTTADPDAPPKPGAVGDSAALTTTDPDQLARRHGHLQSAAAVTTTT